MILNVTLGFFNLENNSKDPRNKIYALFLGDTIQVTPNGAVLLTDYEKDLAAITYTFGEDEDEEDTKILIKLPKRGTAVDSQRKSDDRVGGESKRKLHQAELFEKIQSEGIARYAGDAEGSSEKTVAVFKKFESYRKDMPLPKNVSQLKVFGLLRLDYH